MPEKNMTPSVTSGNVSTLLDDQLRARIKDISVAEIKALLSSIVSDDSRGKGHRRKQVARVVGLQSHPTKEFSEYDEWNKSLMEPRNETAAGVLGLWGGLALLPASLPFLLEGEGLETFAYTFAVFALLSFIACFFSSRTVIVDHADRYGKRAVMSSGELAAHQIEEKKKELDKQIRAFSGNGGSMVSMESVKQDYADALARVASYETDFDKALRYPAFNDVTVEETATMVKHMRTCRHHADSGSSVDANVLKDAVDELWVAVLAAERRAKKIALTGVTDEERKGLEQAQKLLVQIRDHGNTEEFRATLYDQLRRVVNRINATDDVVPTKIVAEIETKAALGIETKKEPEHV